MTFLGWLAVCAGAATGASVRWWLSLVLNPVFPTLPLGTLAANCVGGYLIGLVVGALPHFEALSPEVRLLVTTGFLGGLTTFSTFSAEAVTLMSRNQLGWAAVHVAAHVAASLVLTFAGVATMRVLLR
jgi:CrcB protein